MGKQETLKRGRKVKEINFETLKGKILEKITINEDDTEICFFVKDKQYLMRHEQRCCEEVWVEEIVGDLDDLLNSPILLAEEVIEEDDDPFSYAGGRGSQKFLSGHWTFYKLLTIKGSVTIRWYGGSNGEYSEFVDFFEV